MSDQSKLFKIVERGGGGGGWPLFPSFSSSARNWEWKLCTVKCGLEIVSNDRGNNSMLRLEHPRWIDMCAL